MTFSPVSQLVSFVCVQDYAEPNEWISDELGGRMGNGLRRNSLDFGVDTRIFFNHTVRHCRLFIGMHAAGCSFVV